MSMKLTSKELHGLIELINEYMDVFAWNYKNITRLDPKIAQYHLNIKPDSKSIKQQQRKF